MTGRETVELGEVQQTLFFPLAARARARETRGKRPLLRDPKAVEIVQSVDFEPPGTRSTVMVNSPLTRKPVDHRNTDLDQRRVGVGVGWAMVTHTAPPYEDCLIPPLWPVYSVVWD